MSLSSEFRQARALAARYQRWLIALVLLVCLLLYREWSYIPYCEDCETNAALRTSTGTLPFSYFQHKFFSQFYEDRFLLANFFQDMREGVFVELGAADGLLYSNTWYLQQQLAWTGVLIEPNAKYFKRLYSKSKRCRQAVCLNMAVCSEWGYADFLNNGLMGGIKSEMASEHLARQWFWDRFRRTEPVPCGPIGDVLKLASITRIDLFSIDVEGAEHLVVESMDWRAIRVHVVMLERDYVNEHTRRIDEILLANGFRYFGRIGTIVRNVIWVNPDNARGEDEWEDLSRVK